MLPFRFQVLFEQRLGSFLASASYITEVHIGLNRVSTGKPSLAICWGIALWWLARMSRFRTPERFLVGETATVGAEA